MTRDKVFSGHLQINLLLIWHIYTITQPESLSLLKMSYTHTKCLTLSSPHPLPNSSSSLTTHPSPFLKESTWCCLYAHGCRTMYWNRAHGGPHPWKNCFSLPQQLPTPTAPLQWWDVMIPSPICAGTLAWVVRFWWHIYMKISLSN